MTPEGICEFAGVLSIVERADDPTAIPWKFERITDQTDDDRNSCLMLKYYGDRVGERGHLVQRPIWQMKIPMPEETRRKAEATMRAKFSSTPPVKRTRQQSAAITSRQDAGPLKKLVNYAKFNIIADIDRILEERGRAAASIDEYPDDHQYMGKREAVAGM